MKPALDGPAVRLSVHVPLELKAYLRWLLRNTTEEAPGPWDLSRAALMVMEEGLDEEALATFRRIGHMT